MIGLKIKKIVLFVALSFIIATPSFATIRPRNIDSTTTTAWEFQNVTVADTLTAATFTACSGLETDVPAADSSANDYTSEAVGNKTDTVAGDSLISLNKINAAAISTNFTSLSTIDTNVDSILVDTGTTIPADIATVDGNVDSILVDTNTTIPATITTLDGKVVTNWTLITGIDSNVDDILVDTGTTLPSTLSGLDTKLDTNYTTLTGIDAVVDDILVDTNTTIPGTITTLDGKVVTNWTLITGIDSNVDDILVDTGTTIPATLVTIDGNVDSILTDTGTTIPGTITTLDGKVVTNWTLLTGIEDKVDTVDGVVDSILVDTDAIPALLGMPTVGRPVTATLFVSPDGSGVDGSSWGDAYTNIQAALDAASTDADDCTLILIGPHATYYNINTTGDPTWTGNYELKGSHRLWALVKNEHASATSIMKFTGKTSIEDLAFFTADSVDGIIFTKSGYRLRHCGFNSEGSGGDNTAIHIDGSAAFVRGGIIDDVQVQGKVDYTTGLYMNNAKINTTKGVNFHNCTNAVQIVHGDSDQNYFQDIGVGDCNIGFNIDAGNESHFVGVVFHDNTLNIDDEVGDHNYNDIEGEFEIEISPLNTTGVEITAGEDAYGSDTEIIAANAIGVPFKVVAYQLNPSNEETTIIRLSADSGVTHFAESVFASKKGKAAGYGAGSDFIFNKGTRISASVWSPAAGRTVNIWLEIQEL